MKLGWTEEEMMKQLPTKLCSRALNEISDLRGGDLAVNSREESMGTDRDAVSD